MDRTIVVLGCSPDADYSFLLPVTALLWRRIGFEPLALIVGRDRQPSGDKFGGSLEWWADNHARVALEALRHHRIATYSVAAVDGYPYATTAQVVRQHAAALRQTSTFGDGVEVRLEIDDADWIMPADSDLWPIRREFYQRHENSLHKAVSYFWNGDHFLGKQIFLDKVSIRQRSQTIPTCHVVMRARDWREVYGLTVGENLADAVERTLIDWYERFPRDNFNVWMSDQDIMTERLCRQSWFPNGRPPEDGEAHAKDGVLFVGRRGHPPIDRLDRGHIADWDQLFDAKRWTDAHVLRAPYYPQNWQRLLPVIDALIPEHSAWAREYHRAWVSS